MFKKLTLGIDPKVFTSAQIKKFFLKNNKIKEIPINLIDKIHKNSLSKTKPFFSLNKEIVGESHLKKIIRVSKFLKKNKSDYLFITAPENVAWLLNIRGFDNPNSPIPNCRLLINDKGKFYIITDKTKLSSLFKEKRIKKNKLLMKKILKRLLTN